MAIEQVTGTLGGRKGGFVFQHSGTMTQGAVQLTITVVPGSGTGELVGLAGTFKINVVEGIREHGMDVFIRLDHAAGAAEAGLELPPTELIIFGSARAGTPLMQANQMVGIDLPLKALVCRDRRARHG